MKKYRVIGVMSGSSMDGVDLALCEYWEKNHLWHYKIIHANTLPYTADEMELLKGMPKLSAERFIYLDREVSKIYAEKISQFLSSHQSEKPMLIAFHGHTVFHNPSSGYTYQAGHGGIIASLTGIPVVSDFRTQDIALGGEGAPLVPLGDEVFFNEYDAVLNLGGIANVSFKENGIRKGFDIVPVNQILNYLAQIKGFPYDANGNLARKGKLIPELFDELIKANNPENKSLGREFVDTHWLPIIEKHLHKHSVEDIMNTVTESISSSLSKVLSNYKKILITGGGVYNLFLVDLLKKKLPESQLVIPCDDIIQFKEALIFGFLGLLRFLGMKNTLPSVTHSRQSSSSGALWMP